MRRTLIIGSVVVVVLGLGVAAYFLFFNNAATVGIAPNPNVSLPSAGNNNNPPPGNTGQGGATKGTAVTARLVKVDKGPVVPGFVAYKTLIGASATASGTPDVAVNFIERQSGNIFTYLSTSGVITRISNRTVPGIQEAVWLPNASSTFVRYLSNDERQTINTYALPANGDGGFFLPQNLSDIAVSTSSVLTLASGVNGSVGTLLKPDGSKAATVFSSSLTSLRIGFAGKQYAAFTKPASALDGYAFLIDKAGAFTRVAGPLKGLVALPSPTTGKWMLISYVAGSSLKTSLVNTTTNEVIALPVSTIADKCAWTPAEDAVYCGVPVDPDTRATYPDDWYQGATSFSDRIWKIDVTGRFASLALDFPKETSSSLDATALAIDPNEQLLVFQNKIDGSLWAFRL